MRLNYITLTVFLALFLSINGFAQSSINEGLASNIYYASPNGLSSNNGLTTNAPMDLQTAINTASSANSKIWLMDGVYRAN